MADAAATVILCPQCSKKFKLPAKPHAVFTCTGCGTAMDLSAFRAAAPAVPAAPASAAAQAAPEPRRSHRSSRGGGPARLTARVHRDRADADEDDVRDERASRAEQQKQSANKMIIFSLVGFIVVVGLIFIMLKKKSGEEDAKAAAHADAL